MDGAFPDGHDLDPLTRPSTVRGRWRGRLEAARAQWRRLAVSLAVGVAVGLVSLLALAQLGAAGDPRSPAAPAKDLPKSGSGSEDDASVTEAPNDGRPGPNQTSIDLRQRVMAVDIDSILLPLEAGDRVELVGLRPTVTAMEAVVVAAESEVVAVTSDAVLVLVTDDQALRASEIQAIGALTVFGLARPTID